MGGGTVAVLMFGAGAVVDSLAAWLLFAGAFVVVVGAVVFLAVKGVLPLPVVSRDADGLRSLNWTAAPHRSAGAAAAEVAGDPGERTTVGRRQAGRSTGPPPSRSAAEPPSRTHTTADRADGTADDEGTG